MPWVYWLDHYFAPFIGHRLNTVLRHGLIRAYASKAVQERKDRVAGSSDILGQLFRVQQQKPDALDDNAITSIATATVFAGSDTTAISLRAIVYFLLQNPRCLDRLRQETTEREIQGLLTFPATYGQLSEWPYLQAVISEALRLHPAVGLTLPRVVPEGGIRIEGNLIPAGVCYSSLPSIGILFLWLSLTCYRPLLASMLGSFTTTRRSLGKITIYSDQNAGSATVRARWNATSLLSVVGSAFALVKVSKTRPPEEFGLSKDVIDISLMEISKVIPLMFKTFDIELVDPGKGLREDCQ
jgi:hypothetical protein